jgi:hypothetical protein
VRNFTIFAVHQIIIKPIKSTRIRSLERIGEIKYEYKILIANPEGKKTTLKTLS